jgi:DNA-binding transcriptional MerR regulator
MVQNTPTLLTKIETAEMLRVTPRTLDRWREAGLLVPLLLGRNVRYRLEDVQAFIANGDVA